MSVVTHVHVSLPVLIRLLRAVSSFPSSYNDSQHTVSTVSNNWAAVLYVFLCRMDGRRDWLTCSLWLILSQEPVSHDTLTPCLTVMLSTIYYKLSWTSLYMVSEWVCMVCVCARVCTWVTCTIPHLQIAMIVCQYNERKYFPQTRTMIWENFQLISTVDRKQHTVVNIAIVNH